MITSGAIQPNLNTGTLNVTIPVYVWEDEDFRIPIQLYYSTNGFKPARQTGIVGLDWSCQIGGVITRQIVGIDDFDSNYGYYKPSQDYTNEDLYEMYVDIYHNDYKDKVMFDQRETNPDIFHFNFLNHSGSFVIDDDGSFKVFDSNGERGCYDITYTAGSDKKFTIKTGDGYEYHFGSDNSSKEYLYLYNPLYLILNSKGRVLLNNDDISVIAWHLDEIHAPNGRKLTFSYSTQPTNDFMVCPDESDLVCTTFARGYWQVDNTNNSLSPHQIYKYPSFTTVSYIDRIQIHQSDSSAGRVIIAFDYSQKECKEAEETADHINYALMVAIQKKLDNISFYNHNQELLSNLSLSYVYRNTRMLLDQINISNIGTYKFEYNIENEMPDILTNAQDFWGFYNGNINNIDEQVDPTTLDSNYDEHVSQNFMNPNYIFSKVGTLKSITYPTGGHSEFEYEANTADQILMRSHLPSDSSLDPFLPSLENFHDHFLFQECGGVRIKSISDYNDTTCMYRRSYSYNIPETNKSSGIVLKFNKYHNVSLDLYSRTSIHFNFPDNSLDRLHVAYSYVTEHFPDGSYKVYRFTDYLMHPDEYSPFKKSVVYDSEYPTVALATFMNNISREPNSRHYRRGLIKSIEDYSNDNNLLFKKEYEYEDSDSSYIAYIIGSGKYWWSARRFTCDYLLKSIKETYYRNGSISTLKSFAYNSAGQKTLESISDITGMNGKRTYYRYCNEVGSSYGENIYKNVPSDIIQTTMRNGMEYLVSNTQLLYDTSSKNPNPIQIRKYCIQTPILVSATQSQDAFINTGRNQPYIKTLYTYNGQHRLTKVQEDGNSYISYVWDGDMNHVIQKTINTPEQTFTYTWKDMVGLSGATSPTGVGETYQYDVLNRLEAIHDSQGKITRQYFYHIYNE